MATSDNLLKAAINRIKVRLGDQILDLASQISVLSKDAPGKLQKEWELLKEEIYSEAERLTKEENENDKNNSNHEKQPGAESALEKIDSIRARVAKLHKVIDNKYSNI